MCNNNQHVIGLTAVMQQLSNNVCAYLQENYHTHMIELLLVYPNQGFCCNHFTLQAACNEPPLKLHATFVMLQKHM